MFVAEIVSYEIDVRENVYFVIIIPSMIQYFP